MEKSADTAQVVQTTTTRRILPAEPKEGVMRESPGKGQLGRPGRSGGPEFPANDMVMQIVNSKGLVPCWGTPEPYVDADTAAAFLGITRRTLLNWAREHKIPGYPLDPASKKKDWRFKLSELDRHMLNSRLQPPEPPIRRI